MSTLTLVRKAYAFTLATDQVEADRKARNPRGAGSLFRYNPPVDTTHGELLKGYMSTWDVDLVFDKLMPGAFQKTIQDRVVDWTAKYGAPFIKIMRDHEKLAGILHHIVEDDIGVWIEFWALNTKTGRDFYTEVKSGAINQMSFGFYPLRTKDYTEGSKTIRQILEVDVLEGSGVLWPCNEATHLRSRLTQSITKSQEDTMWLKMCQKLAAVCDKQVGSGEKLGADAHGAIVEAVGKLCKVLSCCGEGSNGDASTGDDKAAPMGEMLTELDAAEAKSHEAEPPVTDTDNTQEQPDAKAAETASESSDVSSEPEQHEPTVDTKSDSVLEALLKMYQESSDLLARIEQA